MVSQLTPIFNVAATIRRRQNGWHDEDKPIVMLFLVSRT
jgi:ATP-dependent Clp protease ATP-binding subunit ClpB